ncbi:hypothetical protein [Buttiauxella sp. S04-F03]|uniref:hypothetical protein n=1 Tax=Buttiauxella sp. S04-F03 TaxID=2904525 RepID=UPI001E649774|nr:hypothetical protein [Buttiauxella sp. S04-F03]MCE0812954.1 hypothetical protein [Buttiauxella sp. S04-F03]
MNRQDSSNYVYHWIKTDLESNDPIELFDAAFDVMQSIIHDGVIKGSDKFIVGKERCVCFTESPRNFIVSDISRYQPFGFGFSKQKIFELGGRPVIYQPSDELRLLDNSIKWRHVQYDPRNNSHRNKKGIDFTWEREWRLKTDELSILDCVEIIVPDRMYKKAINDWVDAGIDFTMYSNEVSYGYPVPDEPYISYDERFRDIILTLAKDI